MRDNNWFVRFVNFVAVVLRKRVYFSLVQAELADISLQEEYIGTLHAGVEHL
jgi:hypothetical protein